MKCPYCGGEVNTSLMKCKYCDSKIEVEQKKERTTSYNQTTNNQSRNNVVKTANTIKTIAIVFFIVVFITTLLGSFVIPLSGVMMYSSLNDLNVYLEEKSVSVEEERLVDKLPKNAVDLVGEVDSCMTDGTAVILYADKKYSNVKILDSELMEWLVDQGSSIDGIGIMFSTNEDRDINEIALLSNPFYIMYEENDTYVAFREDHVIAFTSEMALEVDSCYEGYFTYPNMSLHGATTTDCGTSALFDPTCDEKEIDIEKAARSDREVVVYKVRVGSDWYYCSENTYDKVNVGDDMSDFTFVGSGYKYIY